MPTYEYQCDPCRTIYQTRHGVNDPPLAACPQCGGSVAKRFSPPNLNLANHTSPTAARYAGLTDSEEMKREKVLQGDFHTMYVPPDAKHNPWDEH